MGTVVPIEEGAWGSAQTWVFNDIEKVD